MFWLHLADWAFLLFHTLLILFNLVGWAWKKTRRFHLASMMLVAFSWLALGAIYGTGYCVCTDLHWRVRDALGTPIKANSYLQFLVQTASGINPSDKLVKTVAGIAFAILLLLSIGFNVADARARRHGNCDTLPV